MLSQLARWVFARRVRKWLVDAPVEQQVDLRNATVVTSETAWAAVRSRFSGEPAQLLLDPPIDVDALRAVVIEGSTVVGIGGGRVMDATKALARQSKRRAVLVPSVLSTTAWLNPTASLKRRSAVHHERGRVDRIVIDRDLIASAPSALNFGGLADLLCARNAVLDWQLAHDAQGERLPESAVRRVDGWCDEWETRARALDVHDPAAIPTLVHAFTSAMSMCWELRSGRPLEGSEHLLYYALEETIDRPLPHGAVIANATIACLQLRGEDAKPVRALYDELDVPWRFSALGIEPAAFTKTVAAMPAFVQDRKFPYSLWNADPFRRLSPEALTESIH